MALTHLYINRYSANGFLGIGTVASSQTYVLAQNISLFARVALPFDCDKATVYAYFTAASGTGHPMNIFQWGTGNAPGPILNGVGFTPSPAPSWSNCGTLTFASQPAGSAIWIEIFRTASGTLTAQYQSLYVLSNTVSEFGYGAEFWGGIRDQTLQQMPPYVIATGGPVMVVKLENTTTGESQIVGNPWASSGLIPYISTVPGWTGFEFILPAKCVVGPFFNNYLASTMDQIAITDANDQHVPTTSPHTMSPFAKNENILFMPGDGTNKELILEANTNYRLWWHKPSTFSFNSWPTMGAGTIPADVLACKPNWLVQGLDEPTLAGAANVHSDKMPPGGMAIEAIDVSVTGGASARLIG